MQQRRDIGSPRVAGSIKITSASVSPGWICSMPGRPAPGRRMRPGLGTPAANSRRPLRIVWRARPVADDTTASPPYPSAADSAGAGRFATHVPENTSIIGDGLRACRPAGRGIEVDLACNILNQMTVLGRPMSYRIGR